MKTPGSLIAMFVRIPSKALLIAIMPLMWVGDIDAQSAKTSRYTYDSLGRLTYVEDSQNGNRDYDYDRAGNRLNVAVGTANDAASNPASQVPVIPAGRSKNLIASCAWRATWTHSPGAGSYSLKNTLNQIYTIYPVDSFGPGPRVEIVNGTTINVYLTCDVGNSQSNEPGMVKACSPDGCSAYGNF